MATQKSKTATQKRSAPREYVCSRCGKSYLKQKGNFSATHNLMFKQEGFLPICVNCVDEIYAEYLKEFHNDEFKAMRRLCMRLDLYWNKDLFGAINREDLGDRSIVRNYMIKTTLYKYLDKTFSDTLDEESQLLAEKGLQDVPYGDLHAIADFEQDGEDEKADTLRRWTEDWGKGYDWDFYSDLDRRYKKYTRGREDIAPTEESLYRQACLLEATIARDGAAGLKIDQNITALGKVLGDLGVKPSQQKDEDDASLEKIPFGVGIKWCEDRRPIPDVDPAFKDQDGIVKYITTWFYGHLVKMAGKKDMYSKLYEDEIARMRTGHPEYDDDENDESFLDEVLAEVGDVT